ncbi:hypothetical protein HMPREF9104_00709, partial [Lentilactobacillus kisonensis F0435]
LCSAHFFRTAPPGRNFHYKHLGQKFQNREFLPKETYIPVSNRLDPLTFSNILLTNLRVAGTFITVISYNFNNVI